MQLIAKCNVQTEFNGPPSACFTTLLRYWSPIEYSDQRVVDTIQRCLWDALIPTTRIRRAVQESKDVYLQQLQNEINT